MTLAQEGSKAYAEAFDLVYRREASHANAMWQADHTLSPVDWVPGSLQKAAENTFIITRLLTQNPST